MTMFLKGTLWAGIAAVYLLAGGPARAQQPNTDQQQAQQQQQKEKASQQTQTTPQRVELANLEENPGKFMGRTITVQGEIDEVLGPRVFKIDEQNWGDLDGEILVVMAAPLAALVDEDNRVTVSGTLRPFVRADVEREWGFLGLDPEVEVDLKHKPVLIASTLVSTDDNMALAVETLPAGSTQATSGTQGSGTPGTAGTSGSKAGLRADSQPPLTDVSALAKSTDTQMVGRRANLTSVKVEAMDKNGGFWVSSSSGDRLYVLPADNKVTANAGQTVTIEGYVLRMPRQMEQKLEKSAKVGNEEIYVYATAVK